MLSLRAARLRPARKLQQLYKNQLREISEVTLQDFIGEVRRAKILHECL